jgi:hypothetical protein
MENHGRVGSPSGPKIQARSAAWREEGLSQGHGGGKKPEHVPAGAGRVACRRQPEGRDERERARQRIKISRAKDTENTEEEEVVATALGCRSGSRNGFRTLRGCHVTPPSKFFQKSATPFQISAIRSPVSSPLRASTPIGKILGSCPVYSKVRKSIFCFKNPS